MYFSDHSPPHFLAEYGEYEALVEIETLAVLRGELPRRAMALVLEWAALHREELRNRLGTCPWWYTFGTDRPIRLGVGMKLVRIREVRPLDQYRVQLVLTDGRTIERDLGPLLAGPIFAEIRNDERQFREMRVEHGTLVWPNGADLCPDVLIWGGLPPAEAASDAA
jgi:hypothetical protein